MPRPEPRMDIPPKVANILDARRSLEERAWEKNGHRASQNLIDWAALAEKQPPPFVWLWDHWLSFHAHGIWGKGGVGKSLLAQQIETALATAQPMWGNAAAGPLPVLAWHCEDDRDEIWRRQDRICRHMKLDFGALDNLHIDARCGLENALFTTEFGRPMWTPLYGELQQQVNDFQAHILFLDNISQIFGGNVNDQHHVTTFVNGLLGLVIGRPFALVLMGHIAKTQGSEFAGNMAWENAIRMRMLFAEKLPDEKDADPVESDTETSERGTDTRFLCKRKANYTQMDYVQFSYENGVFVPKEAAEAFHEGDGSMSGFRAMRAKTVLMDATWRLSTMNIFCLEAPGRSFLPAKIVEMRLHDGFTKQELRIAMNALMVEGKLVKVIVGKYSNRTDKYGLKAVQ